MRLLTEAGKHHQIALFGSGLIGSAIEEALLNQGSWTLQPRRYAWTDDARRRAELAALVSELTHGPQSRCDVVWAAGVSGFGTTREQMHRETSMVAELCRAADELAASNPELEVAFHLVSSGGGLFEGKTRIGPDTQPAPLRPYGVAKLEQEELVRGMHPQIRARIYRPASVYGFRPGARRGLFATMIVNALANKATVISGTERTIRDYISADDVGNFIARKILQAFEGGGTYLLASGKPTSMFEVVARIQQLVGRPLYRRFEPKAPNALDQSFAQSGLPPDLRLTPLDAGLAWLRARVQEVIVRMPGAHR